LSVPMAYSKDNKLFRMSPKANATIRVNASWGLERVSGAAPLLKSVPTYTTFTYKFDDNGGSNVDVYLIDSGIRTTHTEFQGRAKMIWVAPGLNKTDDNGHGTHVAGIVGGKTWGVGMFS
jgi:cerevisin